MRCGRYYRPNTDRGSFLLGPALVLLPPSARRANRERGMSGADSHVRVARSPAVCNILLALFMTRSSLTQETSSTLAPRSLGLFCEQPGSLCFSFRGLRALLLFLCVQFSTWRARSRSVSLRGLFALFSRDFVF